MLQVCIHKEATRCNTLPSMLHVILQCSVDYFSSFSVYFAWSCRCWADNTSYQTLSKQDITMNKYYHPCDRILPCDSIFHNLYFCDRFCGTNIKEAVENRSRRLCRSNDTVPPLVWFALGNHSFANVCYFICRVMLSNLANVLDAWNRLHER